MLRCAHEYKRAAKKILNFCYLIPGISFVSELYLAWLLEGYWHQQTELEPVAAPLSFLNTDIVVYLGEIKYINQSFRQTANEYLGLELIPAY